VPSVLFAYFVGTGTVQTSPALSLKGDKVAFVESVAGGSKFHVLTLDKSNPANNGTAYNHPVAPCTVNGTETCMTNSAVDVSITMNGNVQVTRSSPFVDYANDVAYVGDDTGHIHKFTGVFLSTTPAEQFGGGGLASLHCFRNPYFSGPRQRRKR